jgi:hypothetical protein
LLKNFLMELPEELPELVEELPDLSTQNDPPK